MSDQKIVASIEQHRPKEGVDAGGLKKEWFLLLCRDLFGTFGVGTGMWIQDEESNLCWFHPASFETDEQYTLVGVVVGLAVSQPVRSCLEGSADAHQRLSSLGVRFTTPPHSTYPYRRLLSSGYWTSPSDSPT